MRITFILLLLVKVASAQTTFLEWVNPNTQLRQRFSIPAYTLASEKPNGTWHETTLTHINPEDFAGLNNNIRTQSFVLKGGKRIYITINGSQRVYAFDVNTNHLSRIDRTWNNGYNYNSSQFIRKDTLYSLGGYGFWRYNKVITYFDNNTKEWEVIPSTGNEPETIVGGYQGYDEQLDYFYSGGSEMFIDGKGPFLTKCDPGIYRIDFKTKKWDYLGDLTTTAPLKVSKSIAWTGKYFLHFAKDKLYIMSPSLNKTWEVANGKTFFDNYYRFYPKGDTLICFSNDHPVAIKYSIKRLLSTAKELGPMYATPIELYGKYAFFLLGVLILGFVSFKLIKSKKQAKISVDIVFKNQELTLLNEFIKLSEGDFLTSNDINEIIGISDKGLENQRKIRTAVISQINTKIAKHYRIGDAIERKDHPEDKRLKLYKLKKKALIVLKKSVLLESDKK